MDPFAQVLGSRRGLGLSHSDVRAERGCRVVRGADFILMEALGELQDVLATNLATEADVCSEAQVLLSALLHEQHGEDAWTFEPWEAAPGFSLSYDDQFYVVEVPEPDRLTVCHCIEDGGRTMIMLTAVTGRWEAVDLTGYF